MTTQKHLRTAKQQEILTALSTNFGINEDRVLFINPRDENDPWIPADELESIARQTNGIKSSSVLHDKFVQETQQVAYVATIENIQGIPFTRSGVATIGEKPNGIDMDADVLASGRALGAALRAAGFHPYRSGSVVDFAEMKEAIEAKKIEDSIPAAEAEGALRKKDLAQIHALAEEKGLIVGKDQFLYRAWLADKFGVRTAAALDAPIRARVINLLRIYQDDFADLDSDLRDDAMVA